MLPPDLALALLINRAATAYVNTAPAYMTYRESTHVEGANRTEDINRTIAVRVADNFSVMKDLPQGAERTGEAFPIIAYFDPFSQFSFSYFANLKRVDINLERKPPGLFPVPSPDPSVDAVIPYSPYWAPRYAPDSTPMRLHFLIDPTPRTGNNTFYPSDVVEDPQSGLPSHIEMRVTGSDETISLDYAVIDGHWVVTHGTFSASQRVLAMAFKVSAGVTYDQFAFPQQPPDPRLAPSPSPLPGATTP
jgi:hypothetical protein